MAKNKEPINPWEPYEKESKKQKKFMKDIQSIWDYASEINHLLNPHHYMVEESCYGENDIRMLLKNEYVDSDLWPQPIKNALCPELSKNQIIQYYKDLFERLTKQYTKYLIDNNIMYSFNHITKHQNIIDISKLFEHENQMTMPDICFYEHQIQTMISYSWYTFRPCFDEFVIKVNKRKYLYIQCKQMDENNKTLTIEISDYLGNKFDWIITGKTTIELSFEDETNDGLPCKTHIIETKSYEEYLSEYISNLKWTKNEIKFWFHLFGIEYIDNMIVADFNMTDDEEDICPIIVLCEKDYTKLLNITNKLNIYLEKQTKSAKDFLQEKVSQKLLIDYLKSIAIINYNLFVCTHQTSHSDAENNNRSILSYEKNGQIIKEFNNIKIQCKTNPKVYTPKGEKTYE